MLQISVIAALLLLSSFCLADEILPDLVTNYSDFSYITSIAVGYHYIYFGSTNGIIRYNFTEKRWAEPMLVGKVPGTEMIHQIKASFDDENIWVRTNQGIFEYSKVMERWSPITEMPQIETRVRHLTSEEIFYAPWGYELLPGGVLTDEHDRSFPLTDIVDDGWSNLWIGTWGLGAAYADNAGRMIELLPYGMLQKNITTIHSDDSLLWISGKAEDSYRTGITIFNKNQNSFEYVETFGGLIHKADDINAICSNEQNIFVGTDNGIRVVDKKDRTIYRQLKRSSGLPDNRILSMLTTGDTLFVGTEYGLGIINIYADSVKPITKTLLPSLTVLCLEKADEDLWIGTTNGVYRLNLLTNKVGYLSAREITQTGIIYDIEFDGRKIWLVTEDELASVDIKTAEIELYPEVNNYGGARAIAIKDTLLAIAANQGLLLIYNGEKPYYRLFTVTDGLISDNIRDIVIDNKYLWLGTDRGLIRFWYKNPALY